jgi:hypothetical protein
VEINPHSFYLKLRGLALKLPASGYSVQLGTTPFFDFWNLFSSLFHFDSIPYYDRLREAVFVDISSVIFTIAALAALLKKVSLLM